MKEFNDYLTGQEVADTAGLKYKTLWTYLKRNTLPEPDLYLGNKPLWKRSTIDQWNSTRSKKLSRSDSSFMNSARSARQEDITEAE